MVRSTRFVTAFVVILAAGVNDSAAQTAEQLQRFQQLSPEQREAAIEAAEKAVADEGAKAAPLEQPVLVTPAPAPAEPAGYGTPCRGTTTGNTIGNMKVAISVPDPLFEAADNLARQLKKSRSQFYAEAVAAYLGSLGEDAVREQLNAVYATQDSSPDPVLTQMFMETLDPNETW